MYSDKSVDGLKAGDTVIHTIFGEGVIIKISGSIATIAFKYGKLVLRVLSLIINICLRSNYI